MARTREPWNKKFFEVDSFITGYHVYREFWQPELGQFLNVEIEPSNVHDRFAVAVKKDKKIIGHLPRDNRHLIFFFIQEETTAKCIATVTGPSVNLGDKLGQKVPCKLRL